MRIRGGEWTDPCLCSFLGYAIAAGALASVASAGIGASAAISAADTQAAAAGTASSNALAASQGAAARLQPFTNLGLGAGQPLSMMTGTAPGTSPSTSMLTAPFSPADLTNTPGYKFTLDQGLQATQNSYAAQGLGRSGAALKGAAGYATGLAQSTYNQQLNNYLTQNRQVYDMLMGQTQLGENAAVGAGGFQIQGTTAANSYLTGGAAASAGGTVGAANALTGGFSGTSSNALLYALLNKQPAAAGTPNLVAGGASNTS